MIDPILDPVLLRSFVAVVESGSFTRAGDRVHLSQSTVSQHLRRLEEQLGSELLDRSGRYVVTTESGARLLVHARKLLSLMEEAVREMQHDQAHGEIRLGVPEDFASGPLMPLLASFVRDYPALRLEVSSGLSNTLLQQYSTGSFDLVLAKQRQGHTKGEAAWSEPLAWFDSHQLPSWQRAPLPLVVFPVGGLYRDEMIHSLESQGRRWQIAFSSASLASVRAAVAHGLGVSLLPRRLADETHHLLSSTEGFAPLPPLELVLHYRSEAHPLIHLLASRLIKLCEDLMHEEEERA